MVIFVELITDRSWMMKMMIENHQSGPTLAAASLFRTDPRSDLKHGRTCCGFVLFQPRLPGVYRRSLSLLFPVFPSFSGSSESSQGRRKRTWPRRHVQVPPPAAGGRNEPRRTAPSLPPRKTPEGEDGGKENGDGEQKETSSVAAVAGGVKTEKTNKREGLCYTMAARLAVRATFRSSPPARVPLSAGSNGASGVKRAAGSAASRR